VTLERMARCAEDLTLDFAPGVMLLEKGSRFVGSGSWWRAYSFLNMVAVYMRRNCGLGLQWVS